MIKTIDCADCRAEFSYDHRKGSARKRCDTCTPIHAKKYQAERQKAWRDANPDRAKEHWNKSNRRRLADPEFLRRKREDAMRRAYGLEPSDLDRMRREQNDLCAICGNEHVGVGSRLHVDHNHATGAIRALLCGKCNTLIGLADDHPERLEAAAAYLRRHNM